MVGANQNGRDDRVALLVGSFLAMADPAAHPALLAADLATSLTSAAASHAFSSEAVWKSYAITPKAVKRGYVSWKSLHYTELQIRLKAEHRQFIDRFLPPPVE
jgi:hypothetical protein